MISNSSLSNADSLQIVSFSLGKEEFAINIKNIQEIIKVQPITMVPLTKPFVAGVMSLRGNIIPVINLKNYNATWLFYRHDSGNMFHHGIYGNQAFIILA